MQIDQQIIKNTLYFLGLMFIICGAILIFYPLLVLPNPLYFLQILPELVTPILILSVGIALTMVSKAF